MLKLSPFLLLLGFLATGCIQKKADTEARTLAAAKDSISILVTNTAKEITAKGPIAWLDVFENSPDFYMASDGAIVLKDYPSAEKFIMEILVKQLPHIKLQFSQIRITALSNESGSVGAVFREELTDSVGTVTPIGGYFTATAHHTTSGWKYGNLHWSITKQ